MLLCGISVHLRLRITEVRALLPPTDLITHHQRHTKRIGDSLLQVSATTKLGEVPAATIEHRETSPTIEISEAEAWYDERQMRR